MQLGNFIDVFLARHASGTYAHHQEHWMLSCSIWISAPSFWMGGGLESHCVGRVYGADGAVRLHLPSCIKLAFHFISAFEDLAWHKIIIIKASLALTMII